MVSDSTITPHIERLQFGESLLDILVTTRSEVVFQIPSEPSIRLSHCSSDVAPLY
jgi:hypothetical protein